MFLKRLELHGFKSFADKTVLEFGPGITLVVGPNGSGKSNITDAVRWVLGEQSVKSLRGGKMEDVIFAGSEKRRSLGLAEVSLTIDNTAGDFPLDFNEVTVTRRLYRSGESEYQINQVPCRLKDIRELFMDTGVGREGFSLIGQGRVEEILLARPEERRLLLEDAAGVVKYRYRKKEAAKKLEETRQHLLRLDDLLLELESRREPLARQAAEARRYRLVQEELGGLELGLMAGEVQGAQTKLEAIEAELGKAREQLAGRQAGFLRGQSREESLRLELTKLNEALGACQEEIYRLSLERQKLEDAGHAEERQALSLTDQARQIKEQTGGFQKEIGSLEAQLQSRRQAGDALRERVAAARERLSQAQAEQDAADRQLAAGQAQGDRLREEQLALLKEEAGLQNRITGYREQLAAAARQAKWAEDSREKAAEDLAQARQKADRAAAQVQSLQAEEARSREELTRAEAGTAAAAAKLDQKQKANGAIAADRSQALSRFRLLEEMEKAGQGYGQGVREVLRRRSQDRLPGILGTVAQCLRTDKQYETAVEIALGGAAQNVITETERSAQEAIRWLKSTDKGRVTFLPLDTLRPARLQGPAPKGRGIIGRLVDLVDFEDRYLAAMEFLLGRVWLAESLTDAVARARETGFHCRIVTLDGQVVNTGGSLTGGSARSASGGFISRRRQIEELDRQIRRLSQELGAGEAEEKGLKQDWEKAREAAEAGAESLHRVQLSLTAAEQGCRHSQEEARRCEAALTALEGRREGEGLQKAHLEELISQAESEGQVLEEKISENRRQAASLQQSLSQGQSQRAGWQSRLTELRIQQAGDEEKLNSFDKEGSLLHERLEQLKSAIASQLANRELCLERSRRHRAAGQEIQERIGKLDLQLADLAKQKQESQDRRRSLTDKAGQLDESQKAAGAAIQKDEEHCHQLELQETRLRANLEEWQARLAEQYGPDWPETAAALPPLAEKRRVQTRVRELREEIEAMAQVNLGALEEYRSLEERLAFLKGQTEDLVRGQADLTAVIRETDGIVAERFRKTFAEVNEKFGQVFRRLFDGGQASLYMTDPSNLLESGVDILAQPPGKKSRNLDLLSGGEKALAAISLLLALLQARPSPFSILDEIESALDEANVERFAALLKEYSRQSGSQFIVITHRRGTMTVGDVLYGVSAEEFSGVSKILSVKIAAEPEHSRAGTD